DAIDLLLEDGINVSVASNMTFEKIDDKWLQEYAATGVKRGSIRIREKEVKLLNKHLAKSPITDITHNMKQNDLMEIDKEEYAKTTISGVNTCSNMIFKYAIRNKLIKDNPREGAVIPKKSMTVEELENDKIEDSYFESKELDDFLKTVLNIGLELDREWF